MHGVTNVGYRLHRLLTSPPSSDPPVGNGRRGPPKRTPLYATHTSLRHARSAAHLSIVPTHQRRRDRRAFTGLVPSQCASRSGEVRRGEAACARARRRRADQRHVGCDRALCSVVRRKERPQYRREHVVCGEGVARVRCGVLVVWPMAVARGVLTTHDP